MSNLPGNATASGRRSSPVGEWLGRFMRRVVERAWLIVLLLILGFGFLLIFRTEIAGSIRDVHKVTIGSTTIDFSQPQSQSDIEAILFHLAGPQDGVRTAYLRMRLDGVAKDLRDMQNGELAVSTPATIFNELLLLVQSTSRDIYAVNSRPEVWTGTQSPLSYTYDEYLQANAAAVKRGVRIHRLLIFPRSQAHSPRVLGALQKHFAAGVDVSYAFAEDIINSDAFHSVSASYDVRRYGLPFNQVNLSMYDHEVIVHTLEYGAPPFRYPTKLRITWAAKDLSEFNPEPLFNAPGVHKYAGHM